MTSPKKLLPRRTALACLALSPVAFIAACSPKDQPAPTPKASLKLPDSYDILSKDGKGFVAGSLLSANTVYVMFDPQCPHCGHLWQQAQPLLKKVKFVWMPVSFINAKSTPQGAALLTAANPAEAMSSHEASLLAGTGGTSASSNVPDDIAAAIKKNTDLFNALGVESVPFIVAKNASTGQVVTKTGAMETEALVQFLGLN